MSATALDRLGQRAVPTAAQIGQQTAVEQARAVAEVAAAVQVAQQFPRDLAAVREEVEQACRTMSLARKAFYAVQNRGEGKSVHLARELARIYGNFQSGVHELRRDDDAGISEVQAFAWDVQTNNRSTRTFVSPHQRMRGGQRVPLVDLNDVYLSNQNTGARAVRECIFAALPNWLVDLAEDECRKTLQRGDGEPLDARASKAVAAFARMNVTQGQLEQRIGRTKDRWDAQDVASLGVLFDSIRSGEASVEEQFEPARVTADEITRRAPAKAEAPPEPPADDYPDPSDEKPRADRKQVQRLQILLRGAGMTDREKRLEWVEEHIQRPIESTNDLTYSEAVVCIGYAEQLRQPSPDPAS